MLTIWIIWNNRNQSLHNLSYKTPNALIREVGRRNEDITQGQSSTKIEGLVAVIAWQIPPEGIYKLNVDAAFSSVFKEASLGMVVRNHLGQVHHCAIKRIGNMENALHAEFKAILFGLEECRHNSFNSVIIENDSLMAIMEIEESMYEWEGIISDIF
ncbi:hypothetical protein CRYUN_Cryun12cG0094700 [Craigia yunnanensis]